MPKSEVLDEALMGEATRIWKTITARLNELRAAMEWGDPNRVSKLQQAIAATTIPGLYNHTEDKAEKLTRVAWQWGLWGIAVKGLREIQVMAALAEKHTAGPPKRNNRGMHGWQKL
jgi:hypothetical protein